MIRRVKKLTSGMTIPCYLIALISLLYWLLVGLEIIRPEGILTGILMSTILLCSIALLILAVSLDRFFVKDMEESLDNLSELNKKLRAQRHEYLNEMQVVYGLLELGEYEEAYHFLRPVYQDVAQTSRSLKTSMPAVNALLQNKMGKAESIGARLYLEISSNLAGIPVEAWSLCKVLGNLIDNALTAVEENEGEKNVHVTMEEDAHQYELCVYNNGPVIEESLFDKIFRNGYSSKKEEGHGYGLGIVSGIVQEAGGRILVSSVPGKTAFTVEIPKNPGKTAFTVEIPKKTG